MIVGWAGRLQSELGLEHTAVVAGNVLRLDDGLRIDDELNLAEARQTRTRGCIGPVVARKLSTVRERGDLVWLARIGDDVLERNTRIRARWSVDDA